MNSQSAQRRALSLRSAAVAILLALLAAIAVCSLSTARAFADDPIEISTAEELRAIPGNSDKSYVLTADIDLGGTEWTPIGKPSNFNDGGGTGFRGTFDGNGHTIKNVTMSSFLVGGANIQYAGFFGCTKGATIKGLTLENVSISGAYSGGTAHDLMAGSLVGLAVNTSISGCNVVDAAVRDAFAGERSDEGNYSIGGLVGDFYADGSNKVSISNSSVSNVVVSANATFSGDVNKTQAFAGGIVGRIRERTAESVALVSRCVFEGEVYGAGYVGPLVGGARGVENPPKAATTSALAASRAQDSFFSGSVTGPQGHPSPSHNCGEGVWDADWNYLKATKISDGNRAQALSSLGGAWRIATLSDGRAALVLDYRRATIDGAVLEAGKAAISARLSGYYGEKDENAVRITWLVDGVEKGSGESFVVPLSVKQQTVEMRAMDGGKAIGSDSATIEAAQLEFSTTKARDAKGDVESVSVLLRKASDGFAADNFSYAWYALADGQDPVYVGDGETLDRSQFRGSENFKVTVTSTASGELIDELTVHTGGRTVYLKSDGQDGNSGFEPGSPVATFQKAYDLLKEDVPREANVIVVMDPYTNTEYGYDDSTFNKPATITSYDADLNVDYRAEQGALLSLYNTSGGTHVGDDSTRIKGKLLFADTTFKDITLSAAGGGESKWRIGYIYCQGFSLTMDTGVRMEGYRRTSEAVNSYGLLAGTNSNDFNIVGGFANYDEAPGAGYPQDRGMCEIVIRSGSYGRVIAGGRNYDSPENGKTGVNRTSHNQFATEDEPFRVSVTVDIASDQSQMGSGGNNCDIGQLTGGQTDGTIYCESTISLKNGVVPQLFGSSIGYNRSVNSNGTTYPNNDFVGTVQVNMEGGSVAQLYGGCLGRTAGGAKEKVDARFRSFTLKQGDEPDIQINISGDAVIGKIPGITAPLTGVFAAGAGGVTGEGDPMTGTVTNHVDVKVNISGGTITGKLYGGGYGQSSAVTDASLVCLEAGNLYGSSTVNITGGTVNADVYGGGAGTEAYLANNKDANALAQIVGDVKLSISNAEINGSVYGGSQGVVQRGHDCTSMAKINGSVSLSLENAHVTGSVYGGSALGAVAGGAATSLSSVEVDGSVYGAGKGSLVSAYDLEQQKAVGLVGGNVSLEIAGGSVQGSLFGGGSVGAVLGEGGTTTTLSDVSVVGSVYGGGEGSIIEDNADVERQALIGQVASNAALSVGGSTVGGSVYGGGSKGAVLGFASVQLDGAEVVGSAYAAGEGAYLEGDSDIALQKVVGWVKGGASIGLARDARVGGSVFGGGHLGVVGDGALSSGSIPYSIGTAAKVAVRVENARVGGSVFGGGEGEASAGSLMSRLLGAVFGAAQVVVHEGTIGADVFGGGDQSYSYAPLDENGSPAQAATVIVNGGNALYVKTDGSVADGSGDGAREVDVPSGDAATARTISLGGSVFGGGNISDAHTVSANNYTMYGGTEVFVKGQGTDFANLERGGVYGDGNLSRVHGERMVTLVELRTPKDDGTLAAKSFFSLQRANRAVVHDCSIYLRGAKDLVNESDQVLYSLNRVEDLNLYANSTIQFDTVVNGLGNLYSDVLPDRVFTSGQELTDFGDNMADEEKDSYRKFATGQAGFWTDSAGGRHSASNTIIVNNGKWLDVKQAADAADASYGAVTGLFSLISSDASSGGSFVFGRLSPNDSTGTFVSLNRQEGGPYLELYTKPTSDADAKPCRVWFIKGASYTYERDLRAYTTSDSASVRMLLPVEWAEDGKMSVSVDGSFAIDGAPDMTKGAEKGKYDVSMVLADSDPLPLLSGENSQWSYDYAGEVSADDKSPALLPAIITVDIADLGQEDELEPQTGTVEFSLLADDGTQYHFKINIVIERVYAVAYETMHPGRIYENIAVKNTMPITPTSSYTAQFTTTYSPGAYRSAVEASLNAFTTEAIHGESHDGQFPAGTQITMVNITDPMRPAYYYYECGAAIKSIPLTDFKSMTSGARYVNPTGNTIIVEDLLFVVDYSQANRDGEAYLGHAVGAAYLALNHAYGTQGNDILSYTRSTEGGGKEQRYNNLWNSCTISSVTDKTYLSALLRNPVDAASMVVDHTDDFMYDTYTTKLVLTKASNCVSTLFDENHVMMQLSLHGESTNGSANPNTSFPLGTRLVVKRLDGTEVATRYFHEGSSGNPADDPSGYLMADLGDQVDGEYLVELQVSRYVDGGVLGSAFRQQTDGFKLNIGLYASADGLSRTSADPFAQLDVEFFAARRLGQEPPAYELGNKYDKGVFLKVEDGQVKGSGNDGEIVLGKSSQNENADAEMTVLRRPAGSSDAAADIVGLGGAVTRAFRGNNIVFNVVDTPTVPGTYEYEIRIGNTVYFQTVAVP